MSERELDHEPGCPEAGRPLPAAAGEGAMVVCGTCGAVLAERQEWYVPKDDPLEDERPAPEAPTAEDVAAQLARMEPEQRAALIALLQGE